MLGSTGSGSSGVCATTTAGDTYCWGQQAGPDGVLTGYPSPQWVPTQLSWHALATGAAGAVCGIAALSGSDDAGTDIYCWGSGRDGLFGLASTANYSTMPVKVAWPGVPQAGEPMTVGAIWYRLSIGARSACAVSDSNLAYCWGLNDRGELGSGSTSPVGEVVREARRVGSREMTIWDISVGDGFACATGEYNGTYGHLWCWGERCWMLHLLCAQGLIRLLWCLPALAPGRSGAAACRCAETITAPHLAASHVQCMCRGVLPRSRHCAHVLARCCPPLRRQQRGAAAGHQRHLAATGHQQLCHPQRLLRHPCGGAAAQPRCRLAHGCVWEHSLLRDRRNRRRAW